MKAVFVTTVLFLTLACAAPTAPIAGILSVRAVPLALKLTNGTSAPVYTLAVERATAALINWAPCTDPVACSSIKAGQTVSLPYAQILGYTPGAHEALVYWWHLVPDEQTGFRPDSIRVNGVELI